MTHYLKIKPIYLDEIINEKKLFEVRKNDRNFKEGDTLVLQSYDNGKYLGKEIEVEITYVLNEFEALKDGYVVLGIKVNLSYKGKVKEKIEMLKKEIRHNVQEVEVLIAKREVMIGMKEGLIDILEFENRRYKQ